MISIYVLYDPLEPSVFRYVGLSDNPYERLQNHLSDPANTYKCRWIRKVLAEGRTPMLIVLDTVETYVEACELERTFIAMARSRGHQLTNATAGGEGMFDPSMETRSKLSMAQKTSQKSIEARAKLHVAARGKSQSTELRARMSAIRRSSPRLMEHLAKLNATKKGIPRSMETRAKIRLAHKMRRTR